jgi:hypothetical protein
VAPSCEDIITYSGAGKNRLKGRHITPQYLPAWIHFEGAYAVMQPALLERSTATDLAWRALEVKPTF